MEVRKERKEKATSILIELKTRLQQIADDPLTVYSDSLRKAVTYALAFRKQAILYIDHDNWDIDNNTGERSMRPLAVGRNNFVSFGSPSRSRSWRVCLYVCRTLQTQYDLGLRIYQEGVNSDRR